jgi:small GTP-binding protein
VKKYYYLSCNKLKSNEIMSREAGNPLLFKISILGDERIGKDNFINAFTTNQFLKESDTGLGVAFYKGSITIDIEHGEQECIVWIWDLKERERYKTLHSRYLKGTNGIMIFFDLANLQSFNKLPNWIDNIKNNTDSEVPILLVGNKEKTKKFAISPNEIIRLIRKFNLYYIEASLTTKEGIFDSFYCITSLTLGVEVDHEFFLSKDIIYYPRSSPLAKVPSSPLLTSKDLSNFGQKAIFKKFDSLEKTFEKSTQIKVPLKLLISEVVLSIGVIAFFITIHLLRFIQRHQDENNYVKPVRFPPFPSLLPNEMITILFILTIIVQIIVIIQVFLSFFKHR